MNKSRFSSFLALFCSLCVIASSSTKAAPITDVPMPVKTVDAESIITITAKPFSASALTAPQSVTVLEGRRLERQRGQTATDAIKDTPGVAAVTTGTGLTKPVIRGLTSQRVLLVSDGVRQEFQQWGDEHSPQIDPLSIDRIEVLRGPNSLLYGSDALGGVIAFTRAPLPDASAGAPKLAGKTSLDYFSNNEQVAGALSLFGAAGPLGYRFSVSGRDGDNFETPDAEVFNSAARDMNGSGSIGFRQGWGQLDLNYGHVRQDVELPEGDNVSTPSQQLTDNQFSIHAGIPVGAGKIDAIAAYQKNRREEFETSDASEPALNLLTKTSSIDLKAHHAPFGPVRGTVGISAMNQDFETLGEEVLIPSYDNRSFGAFIFEELTAGRFTFSAGLRGDTQKLEVQENSTLGVAAQERKYNQMTGALGAVWHAAEPLAFAVNVGRGYRAPVAFELFSNGEHEGTGRFEQGNADLKPERSLNVDVATRYSSKRVRGEIALFRNRISRFIFARPTGTDFIDPDTGDVLPIFQYTQADATLTGGEISVEGDATSWLTLTSGYDVVRGENEQTNQDLPLIPADRFRGGFRVHTRNLVGAFERSYIGAGARVFRHQNRVDPNETETPGYTLWDASAGTEIRLGQTHLSLDLGVENIGDKKYFDHLSRNKTVGILNPGRNFFVKASMPFGIVR